MQHPLMKRLLAHGLRIVPWFHALDVRARASANYVARRRSRRGLNRVRAERLAAGSMMMDAASGRRGGQTCARSPDVTVCATCFSDVMAKLRWIVITCDDVPEVQVDLHPSSKMYIELPHVPARTRAQGESFAVFIPASLCRAFLLRPVDGRERLRTTTVRGERG